MSEAGDLFLYSVKEPVVLGARKSALLPIIDGATKAERVTLLDGAGAVFTAVRLENTTPLTLEGGTLSVFTDGAYTGETQIDRVKPGEVRVLKHGEDLDLEVSRGTRREEGDPRRAKVTPPGTPGARDDRPTRPSPRCWPCPDLSAATGRARARASVAASDRRRRRAGCLHLRRPRSGRVRGPRGAPASRHPRRRDTG